MRGIEELNKIRLEAIESVEIVRWKCAVHEFARLYRSGVRDFRRVDLSGEILFRLEIEDVDFREADLSDTDMSESKFCVVDFSNAVMQHVNFEGVVFEACDFEWADLSRSSMRYLDLHNAPFTYANLSFVDFTGSDLSSAILVSANMYKAHFYKTNLYKADLYGANLTGIGSIYSANLCRVNGLVHMSNMGTENESAIAWLRDAQFGEPGLLVRFDYYTDVTPEYVLEDMLKDKGYGVKYTDIHVDEVKTFISFAERRLISPNNTIDLTSNVSHDEEVNYLEFEVIEPTAQRS